MSGARAGVIVHTDLSDNTESSAQCRLNKRQYSWSAAVDTGT
jgi:hypothetical protein